MTRIVHATCVLQAQFFDILMAAAPPTAEIGPCTAVSHSSDTEDQRGPVEKGADASSPQQDHTTQSASRITPFSSSTQPSSVTSSPGITPSPASTQNSKAINSMLAGTRGFGTPRRQAQAPATPRVSRRATRVLKELAEESAQAAQSEALQIQRKGGEMQGKIQQAVGICEQASSRQQLQPAEQPEASAGDGSGLDKAQLLAAVASLAAQRLSLSSQERDVLRWGCNADVSPPKGTEARVYKKATAFEVLVAYLYLTSPERCVQLVSALLALGQ